MDKADAIFRRYCDLRLRGMDSGEAQATLRQHFSRLDGSSKRDLARRMSGWENNRTRQDLSPETRRQLQRASEALRAKENIICEECHAINNPGTVFCNVCNQMLPIPEPYNPELAPARPVSNADQFTKFTSTSVLLLESAQTRSTFEIHPQQNMRGVTVGRANADADFRADYTLGDAFNTDYGVSRIHAALRYDGLNKTVQIVDLHSTNGTYLNDERLVPDHLYDLKYGDILRLGKLEFVVRFEDR